MWCTAVPAEEGCRHMPDIRAVAFDAFGTLFDVRSVETAIDEEFPGHGAAVGERWRAKQLEYTWLRSLMDRYEDFWTVTGDALVVALRSADLPVDEDVRTRLLEASLHLEPFPEVVEALEALRPHPLHVFSNGTPRMLETMVSNAGLGRFFDRLISVEEAGVYKPSPRCYALVTDMLALAPAQVLFVSANPWDAAGGKSFGFTTAWVRRGDAVMDELGAPPDVEVEGLADLPGWLVG